MKKLPSFPVGAKWFWISLWILTLLVFFCLRGTSSAELKGVDVTTAIANVAKQNIPAVVHIEVTERQEVANPLAPFENDPFFQYFFGQPKMPKKFKRELIGLGTGMLMDGKGHILTNNHVVGGATKIQVVLSDGREYSEKSIKVIGTDPKTDLAVIEITTGENFPYVKFGDSDKMEVGQWVVAIGHPRGLDQTVTQGIISAKHRRGISDPSSYQDFLQTDAAINPGNSGGPLLNLEGEVIGINAAIMSESGGFEGIGFAIPSNMAMHISKELIAHGKVERGWLGLSIQDLTPALAKSFNMSSSKGVLIADVVKGSPAFTAGIKRGDIVTAYNGKEIDDAATLRNDVATAPIGQDISLRILRAGKAQDITVKVGSEQEEAKAVAASLKERLGVAVRPVSPKEMNRYGLEANEGVALVAVDPKGSLGKAGFEVGDIILQVNNETIESPETLINLLSALPANQKVTILVIDHRTGQAGYIEAKL